MKRHLCKILGHTVWGRQCLTHVYCDRCNNSFSPAWWALPFYAVKVAIKEPLQKCPDCGLRFGRHDENVEHVPF